jgi:hypothetical protein
VAGAVARRGVVVRVVLEVVVRAALVVVVLVLVWAVAVLTG